MAFFISTNGNFRRYEFSYLEGIEGQKRLEKTKIHGEGPANPKERAPIKNTNIFAIDIMKSPVIGMEADTGLNDVRLEMKNKEIRHIPILKSGKIVGMISDRDLLKISYSGTFPFLKAKDIMSTIVIATDEETPLVQLANVLVNEKISALPVIDKEKNVIGMISRTDILKALLTHQITVEKFY